MRGCLITLEGGEGAGKSTVLNALRAHVERAGIPLKVTREPGGTPLGEAVRTLCSTTASWCVCRERTVLMFAARAQLVRELIAPALERANGCSPIDSRTPVMPTRAAAAAAYRAHRIPGTLGHPWLVPDLPCCSTFPSRSAWRGLAAAAHPTVSSRSSRLLRARAFDVSDACAIRRSTLSHYRRQSRYCPSD